MLKQFPTVGDQNKLIRSLLMLVIYKFQHWKFKAVHFQWLGGGLSMEGLRGPSDEPFLPFGSLWKTQGAAMGRKQPKFSSWLATK